MKYAEYSKDLKKYKTARENAYYDEKDDGTLVTCGNAIDKLGLYEDIDESPEHLAKIKRALEIIKTNRNLCKFIIFELEENHTTEETELLKEVLL